MKKLIILVMVLLALLAMPTYAEEAIFNYDISNNEVTITGLKNSPENLYIPEMLNGVKVTAIADDAFKDSRFGKIRIPNTIVTIGDSAFYGVEVTQEKVFRIPSSVKKAGNYAFSYLWGIEAFEVEKQNTSFSTLDGVLFDYYKSVLLNYPLKKASEIFVVPMSTRVLFCTSFGNCFNLKKLIVPGDDVGMMGFTFFGTNLTVYGKKQTNLEQSINSLAIDNFERGKVKFEVLAAQPEKLVTIDTFHGMETDLYSITFKLTDLKEHIYLPLEVYLPNGTFVSAKAAGTKIFKQEDKDGVLSNSYIFAEKGAENVIISFIYQLKGFGKDKELTFKYSFAGNDYEDEFEKSTKTSVPIEMYKDSLDHWAVHYIMQGTKKHALWEVAAYGTNLLQPDKPITRAEFASIIRWYYGDAFDVESIKKAELFADVAKDAGFFESIMWSMKKQIMGGVGDGKFYPDKQITREEVAVILKRAMDGSGKEYKKNSGVSFNDQSSISGWAKAAVAEVSAANLMKGDAGKNFKPKGFTTRAEAITMIVRLLH